MRYRIEYADGRCCNFANSRKDLLDWLKLLKDEQIVDIRKIYKSGVTDSVLDSYRSYLNWKKSHIPVMTMGPICIAPELKRKQRYLIESSRIWRRKNFRDRFSKM